MIVKRGVAVCWRWILIIQCHIMRSLPTHKREGWEEKEERKKERGTRQKARVNKEKNKALLEPNRLFSDMCVLVTLTIG